MIGTHPFSRVLYDHDPYHGVSLRPFDPFGWHHLDPIFERIIEKERPQIIIEVGSFKGGSALNMASLVKRFEIPHAVIFCVDTWLGAWGHWDVKNKEAYEIMQWKNGAPTIYETFLSNVIHAGHRDAILPIRQTSSNGARILRHHGIVADAVYLDGSHEYEDVRADVNAYFQLLKRGGVMFGDDYHETYPGVVQAVSEGLEPIATDGVHWEYRKP